MEPSSRSLSCVWVSALLCDYEHGCTVVPLRLRETCLGLLGSIACDPALWGCENLGVHVNLCPHLLQGIKCTVPGLLQVPVIH